MKSFFLSQSVFRSVYSVSTERQNVKGADSGYAADIQVLAPGDSWKKQTRMPTGNLAKHVGIFFTDPDSNLSWFLPTRTSTMFSGFRLSRTVLSKCTVQYLITQVECV